MISFYGAELFAPRPTPKLEDHPLSAVRDCLFSIFAATHHTIYILHNTTYNKWASNHYNTINSNTEFKQLDVTYQTHLQYYPNVITMVYTLPLNKMHVVTNDLNSPLKDKSFPVFLCDLVPCYIYLFILLISKIHSW